MSTKTYWLPYPGLLLDLGFRQSEYGGKNNFTFRHLSGIRYAIHWGKESEGAPFLQLKQGSGTRFYGELQSENEFMVLLRQVGWLAPGATRIVLS